MFSRLLSRLFAPKPVSNCEPTDLLAERLREGKLNTTHADRALRVVYTRAQRMKLLRGGKI